LTTSNIYSVSTANSHLFDGVRTTNASDVIRNLQDRLDNVEGITLYMQPVQDLTVEDRVSRTQYQYTLEDADPNELASWVPLMVDKMKEIPELRDVATDQQNQGLEATLVIDRDTASRLGITPSMIDNTLYDAFGSAAGIHHLHAVESVSCGAGSEAGFFEKTPGFARYLRALLHRRAGAAQRVHPLPAEKCPAGDQPPGAVSGDDDFLQSRPRSLPG